MGAIVIFDLTNKNSFTLLDDWINIINENCPKNVKIIIIGNKSDLEPQREVTFN